MFLLGFLHKCVHFVPDMHLRFAVSVARLSLTLISKPRGTEECTYVWFVSCNLVIDKGQSVAADIGKQ